SFMGASVSPDGRYLAFMQYHRGKRSLCRYDLSGGENVRVVVGNGEDIDDYFWIDTETLVYTVSQWEYYYVDFQMLEVGQRGAKSVGFLAESSMVVRGIVHPLPQV